MPGACFWVLVACCWVMGVGEAGVGRWVLDVGVVAVGC